MFDMCLGVYNMRAYTELIGIGPKKAMLRHQYNRCLYNRFILSVTDST
jgi:hypothetical protein